MSAAGLTGATGPTGPAAIGVTGTQGPAGITGPSLANATTAAPDIKMSAGAQKRPIPIKPNFAKFPAELKTLPNWVLWRYLPPKSNGGKWRKVPFQPSGKPASTTDRSTWSQFEECCTVYAQGGFNGVGFVFDGKTDADGLCYCGIDFDSCIENGKNIHSLAERRIDLLDSYTERSVSGTGVHCIVRAEPLDRIVKYEGTEIYTSARYFTFTGEAAVRSSLPRPKFARLLLRFGPRKPQPTGTNLAAPNPLTRSTTSSSLLPDLIIRIMTWVKGLLIHGIRACP